MLIRAAELAAILEAPSTRVADARFSLRRPEAGREAYEEGHIPGAVHLDLERDLAGPPGEGGRHPLPDPEALARRLGELGIGNEHEVAIYDGGDHLFAARAWWLLRYLGHENARVLEGGLPAWRDEGGELTGAAPDHPPAHFAPRVRPELAVTADDVRARLGDPHTLLIDARAPARYRGEEEPLDPRAGHIPGAVNIPYTGNFRGGRALDPPDLRRRFHRAEDAREVIVYCGSGVSAAANALAMERAGFSPPRLYVGSWSEWCALPDAPLETGEGETIP